MAAQSHQPRRKRLLNPKTTSPPLMEMMGGMIVAALYARRRRRAAGMLTNTSAPWQVNLLYRLKGQKLRPVMQVAAVAAP